MRKNLVIRLASPLIAAGTLLLGFSFTASAANEGTCAEGTTFREGFCYPTNCPPNYVGTPPHCQRTCGPGKIIVDQTFL